MPVRKKRRPDFGIGLLCLIITLGFFFIGPAQTIAQCSLENGAFMDPAWVAQAQSEDDLRRWLEKMRQYRVKYQFIDCGYFDRDYHTGETGQPMGFMPEGNYAHLDAWVGYFKANAPDIALIASVNGSSEAHLAAPNQSAVFGNIAAHCRMLVDRGADGINLDFEPVTEAAMPHYIALIDAVRAALPPATPLSICVPAHGGGVSDAAIRAYAQRTDMLVVMCYDTWPAAANAQEYVELISANLIRVQRAAGRCAVLPIGPGFYRYDEHHKAFENAQNYAAAMERAMKESAVFAGGGLWWFHGMTEHEDEERLYMDYWINAGNASDM